MVSRMDDLISRQAAIDALAEDMPQPYTPDGSHPADDGIFMAQEIYVDCIQTLKNLPSAQPDAVPVVHGRWEYGENESGYDGYYCSKCCGHVRWYGKASEQSINFIEKYNYCPFCGASMDGEQDE